MTKSNTVRLADLPAHYRRAGDVEAFRQRPEVVRQAVDLVRARMARRAAAKERAAQRRAEDIAFIRFLARDGAAAAAGMPEDVFVQHLCDVLGIR